MLMLCSASGNFIMCKAHKKKWHGWKYYCVHCKKWVKEDENHSLMGTEIERWFAKQTGKEFNYP